MVRWFAAFGVGFLAASSGLGWAAAPATGSGGQPAVAELLQRLRDGTPEARAAAAESLGKLGAAAKSAVPALIAALTDAAPLADDHWVGEAACKALADIGPDALPELLAGIKQRDRMVCGGSAFAIAQMGTKAKNAVPELIVLLDKNDPDTRIPAIGALQGIGAEAKAAVPSLQKMLGSEDFHTQYWACRALGAIGAAARPTVPTLCRLTQSGVPSVRRHAAATLGKIGPPIGPEGLDALTRAVADPLEPVREEAVIALGELRAFAAPAVPALREALAKKKLACRVAAARAIWRIAGDADTAVPVLIRQLEDINENEQAAEALAEIGPPAKAAVPALVRHLEDEDNWMKVLVCRALAKIGPAAQSALPALKKLQAHADPDVRREAQAALQRIRGKS